MEWKVFLTGDESDLNELSKSFCGPNLAIVREEEGFVLKSSRFSEVNNSSAIRENAENLLVLLNGGARLALGARKAIALGHIARIGDDGSRSCFLFPAPIRVTARVLSPSIRITHADGGAEEFNPADPVVGWVNAGLKTEPVAKVLRLLATKEPSWENLYRILEVVEEDMCGLGAIVQQGWATRKKLKRFKHTASSPSVIGDDARHGKERTQPPAKPMTFSEARSLIESVVRDWLDTKQNP